MSAWDWVKDRADDARDAYSGAMDFVLPGDGLLDRGESFVDGRSPLSPMAPFRGLAESTAEAAPHVLDGVAQETVPGYGAMTGAAGKVDGFVSHVPGGYAGAGAALLLLLAWLLTRPAARPVRRAPVQVAKGAVKTYAPGAYAIAHGRPAPRRPRAGNHSAPQGTKRRTQKCRQGRADIVLATAKQIEVCARSEVEARACARRRWQGWRLRVVSSHPCPSHPDKAHVEIRKERKP